MSFNKINEKTVTLKGSCMSDTKWSKLLKAIAESDIAYISNEVRAKELACDSLWSILLVDYLGNGKFTTGGIAGPIRLLFFYARLVRRKWCTYWDNDNERAYYHVRINIVLFDVVRC